MINKNYTLHIFATGALFTLGNAIMVSSQFGVVNVVLSIVMPILTILLLKVGKKNKAILTATVVLVFLLAVYGVITTGMDYLRFLTTQQMPKTNTIVLSAIFAAIVIACAAGKTHALYKYSLFIFAILVVIILLFFVGGIKNLEFKYFGTNIFEFSFSAKLVLPLAVLPFFYAKDSISVKPTLCGVLFGALLLFTVVVQSNLTLGTRFDISYSYYHSVGVISFGSLFTRQDGLVWFVFFATALVRSIVCAKVIFNIARFFFSGNIYKQKPL